MRGVAAVACFAIAVAAEAHAKPPSRTAARVATVATRADVRAAPPLPMLPSVARVRIEAARDRVVVVEEVNLPRGDWRSGGLDLYVAFGAPGPPVAIDARLVAVTVDPLESRTDTAPPGSQGRGQHPEDSGDALTVEPAVRRMPSAQLLLGRPQMAGVVVRVKEADLRRAYASSELAALRIRSLLPPPAADSRGARDVVVRLGIAGDLPLTLGRVHVVSLEGKQWITHAEASLCGPEAEAWPLAVTLIPRAERAAEAESETIGAPSVGPIAPAMAVRHASDDLCIRWWAD
jgi:hypothetical protein